MDINTGVLEGRFPRRALKVLLEWYELHHDELLADWQFAERHQPLVRIPPLESHATWVASPSAVWRVAVARFVAAEGQHVLPG